MGLSPMMQHYLQIKQQNKDCIIFYRLGDFYEMFFDDAVKASSLLDLTLTGRDCGLEERAPMCGVPFHAADLHISKLVSLGEKVAICEQLTEAGGKELVKRDIVKIVTAGTITNSELIDDKVNNFLASIYIFDKKTALAWVDITTGEFFTRNFDDKEKIDQLFDALIKISPSEIICNKQSFEILKDSPFFERGLLPKPSYFTDSEYSLNIAKSTLEEQFNTSTLAHFGLDNKDDCVATSGALISYLKQTQKHALTNITNIKLENASEYMMLDANAIRNLELVKTIRDGKRYGSLLWLLDKTKTSMGARKLQSWILSPLNDINAINYRLDGVEDFYVNNIIRQSVHDALSAVKDVGRISGKISNGNLSPKDCVALKNSLEILPNIKFQLLGIESAFISDIVANLGDFSDVVKLLDNAINEDTPNNTKDGGYIKVGFNSELDELRSLSKNSKDALAYIENKERERTGIKTLKIGYNRVFGYFIEVTNSFKDKIPYDYQRKQTLVNAERFITEELKELEVKLLSSQDRALELESQIFSDIKKFLLSKISLFQLASDAIASLDVLIALSIVAKNNSFVRPNMIAKDGALNIIDGRHPVVEAVSKQKFIPNDSLLDCAENRTLILTGPNMAGKSTYMRQTAIIALLAHIGSFVPAKSADIPIIDKIFTRIGASDNLISDQSTFMVEMTEMANILINATKSSLIILDEIGRGTSTYDGLSIAWAVVEHITNNLQAKTMFATHYHELTELEGRLDGVKNYRVTVKELQGSIVFLRKIMRGGAIKSFGIEVSELAGVDKKITKRAKQILSLLEKNQLLVNQSMVSEELEEVKLSATEKIISELDLNNLSPIQALSILSDLQEKIKG